MMKQKINSWEMDINEYPFAPNMKGITFTHTDPCKFHVVTIFIHTDHFDNVGAITTKDMALSLNTSKEVQTLIAFFKKRHLSDIGSKYPKELRMRVHKDEEFKIFFNGLVIFEPLLEEIRLEVSKQIGIQAAEEKCEQSLATNKAKREAPSIPAAVTLANSGYSMLTRSKAKRIKTAQSKETVGFEVPKM